MRSFIVGSVATLLLALVSGCAPADATATGEDDIQVEAQLTVENFKSHARINEVNVEIWNTEVAINDGRFAHVEREGCDDDGRDKYSDPQGTIRKLVVHGGGEHSTVSSTYYYAASGKLRFAVLRMSAEHGFPPDSVSTAREELLYFNAAGQLFWNVERQAVDSSGAGFIPDLEPAPYTAAESSLDEKVETDPAAVFAEDLFCE